MHTEGDLLRIEVKKSKQTQEDFASEMGFSRNYLLRLMERAILPDEIKEKASKILKIDIARLQSVQMQTDSEDGTPIYELAATASPNEYSGQLPEVPAFHVKIPGYEDCNFGVHIYGHSMYPTIENGSLVLCKRVNDKSIIMYGEIYLIRTADYLMVKRLQKNEVPSNVLCTSDNFEKRNEQYRRFEPFELPVDKIIDLYLVKGIIKKTQS
jgi:phage repressor protein C with HTH and peptisase S24 domain